MSNPDLDDNSKGLAFPVCIRALNHTKNRACVGECDWVKLARRSASGGCPRAWVCLRRVPPSFRTAWCPLVSPGGRCVRVMRGAHSRRPHLCLLNPQVIPVGLPENDHPSSPPVCGPLSLSCPLHRPWPANRADARHTTIVTALNAH